MEIPPDAYVSVIESPANSEVATPKRHPSQSPDLDTSSGIAAPYRKPGTSKIY